MKGGSKAVWIFSKNSSDLVAGSFPYQVIVRTIIKRIVITIKSGVISNSEISAQGHFSLERTTRFSTISTIRQRAAFMLRSLKTSLTCLLSHSHFLWFKNIVFSSVFLSKCFVFRKLFSWWDVPRCVIFLHLSFLRSMFWSQLDNLDEILLYTLVKTT